MRLFLWVKIMSYAFSGNINSAAVIRGDISLSIGEPDDHDCYFSEYDEAKALCFATTVFKNTISESDINGAMEEIDYSGYEKAKKFFLECEAEHHGVTVDQLNLVLSGKVRPEKFGMKPSYAESNEAKAA